MPGDVTQLLSAIDSGDPQAAEELLPLVYQELRRLAASRMANERPGHTLQATALVHEAYLRLVQESNQQWQNRSQFLAVAAETMRRILVDRARRRLSLKRGGNLERTDVDWLELPLAADDSLILRVHGALDEFAAEDPVKANVVKLKFFLGLTSEEIGVILGLNEKTVRRHWSFAKAWLFENMSATRSCPRRRSI
jgi:RNA polymerase sigma factor (TIGR02999 family)